MLLKELFNPSSEVSQGPHQHTEVPRNRRNSSTGGILPAFVINLLYQIKLFIHAYHTPNLRVCIWIGIPWN